SRISTGLRHSLRRLPINLSRIPFAWGVRYGVFTSFMPEPNATAEKRVAYFLSRSRIRYFGPLPTGWLLVIVVPSIHQLDMLLFLYVRSFAFLIPSTQTHTTAETTSHVLL